MSNAYYKIYREQTLDLVDSMIIHLEWVGHAMNRELTELGLRIPDSKSEWRYYMHLAGDYHHLDQPIKFISLDTGEEVVLSKELLKTHKKTRSVFINDPSYLDVLYNKYPKQTNLIRGILFPIDYSVTTTAKNGKVLFYKKSLVEKQEQDLISELEQWIADFHYQRFMMAYAVSDSHYITAFLATMTAHMVKKIITIRKQKIKTAQAHSFHVRQYLASHQRLDEFVSYLTLEQQLFLYLNILYIERHTGFNETFNTLIDKIMTLRSLPVYDYTMRQEDMDVAAGNYLPNVVFEKSRLNLDTGITSRDLQLWDVNTVIGKELTLAKDNPRFSDDYIADTNESGGCSAVSKLPTKLLEVSAIDPEDIEAIKFTDVLVNEWAHMASIGLYQNRIEAVNPINGEIMRMDTATAFLVMTYGVFYGWDGVKLEPLTMVPAMGVMEKRWISYDEFNNALPISDRGRWDKEIDYFIDSQFEIYNDIATTEEFLETCKRITVLKRRRNNFVYTAQRFGEKAGRTMLYNTAYKDYRCKLAPDHMKTYADLFDSLNLDYEEVSSEEWKELALGIFTSATGYSSDSEIGLKDIQAAMVRLFKRLSSYSIQFVEEIVSTDVTVVPTHTIIPDKTLQSSEDIVTVERRPSTALKLNRFSSMSSDVNRKGIKVLDVELTEDMDVDANFNIVVLDIDIHTRAGTEVIRPNISVGNVTMRSLG